MRFLTECRCSPDSGHQLRHGAELGLAGDLRRRGRDGAQTGELLRSAARASPGSARRACGRWRQRRVHTVVSSGHLSARARPGGAGRGPGPPGAGAPGPGQRPLGVRPGRPWGMNGLAPADTAGGHHRDVDFAGVGTNFKSAYWPTFLFGGVCLRWGPGRGGAGGSLAQLEGRVHSRVEGGVGTWEGGREVGREGGAGAQGRAALGEASIPVCTQGLVCVTADITK